MLPILFKITGMWQVLLEHNMICHGKKIAISCRPCCDFSDKRASVCWQADLLPMGYSRWITTKRFVGRTLERRSVWFRKYEEAFAAFYWWIDFGDILPEYSRSWCSLQNDSSQIVNLPCLAKITLLFSPHERTPEELELVYEELLHVKALSHLSTMVKRELATVISFEQHYHAGNLSVAFYSRLSMRWTLPSGKGRDAGANRGVRTVWGKKSTVRTQVDKEERLCINVEPRESDNAHLKDNGE